MKQLSRIATFALVALIHMAAHAELSAEELAKLAQNPVGNLISVPFQNNTNLNFGPEKGTQNILNIQPVIPIEVNKDWNIITRMILPVIHMPALSPDIGSLNGVGDIVFTAFLSPANPGHWIWGVGPVVQIPTNSNAELGNKNWGIGPSFVVLHLEHDDPWVYGVLANNIWSVSSNERVARTTTASSSHSSTTTSRNTKVCTSRARRSSPSIGEPSMVSSGQCRSAAGSARSSTSANYR